MPLKINEIFYSIQGESIHAGIPCIFIRLSGCNLRCAYCDTRYAYAEGENYRIPDIIDNINIYPCSVVEITGGEPLIQHDTRPLIDRLVHDGYRVLLETNGSMDISGINKTCIKIVDIKCPSSRESESSDLKNIERMGAMDQLKFVVADRDDYDYAVQIMKTHCQHIPGDRLLLSAVSGKLDAAELAEWILDDGLGARIQLQMHKILWPDHPRGR